MNDDPVAADRLPDPVRCRNPRCNEGWVEEAVNHDAGMWENEEIRWRKALYVGRHSERDRRSIHAEAAAAIKTALRFWKGIPAEYRERVALEAGLPSTAIPEELRDA